jgi:hypothetical protein
MLPDTLNERPTNPFSHYIFPAVQFNRDLFCCPLCCLHEKHSRDDIRMIEFTGVTLA